MNTVKTKVPYEEFVKLSRDGGTIDRIATYYSIGEDNWLCANLENEVISFYDRCLTYLGSMIKTKKNYDSFIEDVCDYMSEIGRFVVCKSIGEQNRLRIFRSLFWNSIVSKDGWWDTFTLSDTNSNIKEIEEGKLYLCQIKKFTTDKDDNTILIVNTTTEVDKDMMDYLSYCYNGYMSSIYTRERGSSLNIAAAFRAVSEKEFFADPSNVKLQAKIKAALYSKTDEELEIESIAALAKTNEAVAKKIASRSISDYICQVNLRYYKLLDRGEIKETNDIVERAILTEEYYAKVKASNAGRKSKKNKVAE